ncbi:hypothetical protein D9619_001167 [Psilocybe cf. subviscida]|uniref:ATP-dependent RNA helicase n=1 Tax=Psilocybe cf. subviscida TaxID=2480587 RepID=A0A8H5F2U7_9AGAR|nr:hypothetical protein D9619_001167 [Psilocybe cf. subviscida]
MMKATTTRAPRRRGPYHGPSRPASNATARAVDPPSPIRAPTPELSIPIPTDTMRFGDLGKHNLLSPILLQTILEDLKFDYMMPVQSATLHDLLAGRIDCLAQAKTGTGKTIAFLLPAIQTMLNKQRKPGSGISLLVISPTRELAMQIGKEAQQLLQRLPQYTVGLAIGGTNKDKEEKVILNGCDILVATPGRLYDHLSDQRVKNQFRSLDTLVLDEADRLLDMGFMNSLKEIIACLPDKVQSRRQGMLFSATIAPHVQKFAHLVLSNGYKFISTIPEGEAATHERVPQFLVTVPTFSDSTSALVSVLRSECATTGAADFKAIVFAPTAAQADWYGRVLSALRPSYLPPVSVLHSRLSQNARTRITDTFRNASSAVIVATDVIARGMDFPNVSTVVQVGAAMDRESYIHRLGRTARAGREGRSVLIVARDEQFFPTKVLRMNFEGFTPSEAAAPSGTLPDPQTDTEVRRVAESIEESTKTKAYQAWLGYYKGFLKSMQWSEQRLVSEANTFATTGLLYADGVPPLQKTTVGKMGLKGVPGLNVVANLPKPPRGPGGAPRTGGGEGRSAGSGGLGRPDGQQQQRQQLQKPQDAKPKVNGGGGGGHRRRGGGGRNNGGAAS